MKYTNEIEIDLPVSRVVELFDNPDNMKKWMEGLISFEHVSGKPGYPGAVSKLKFKNRNREMEMTETITVRDLPREFSGVYEMKGVWNGQKMSFIASGPKTIWKSETEFRFDNFFMKLMGFLIPGAFKKQSLRHMMNFKAFAEGKPWVQ
jgi:hypothetical protein